VLWVSILPVCTIFLLDFGIKTSISNLMRMTRFWHKPHQVCSKQKDWKSNIELRSLNHDFCGFAMSVVYIYEEGTTCPSRTPEFIPSSLVEVRIVHLFGFLCCFFVFVIMLCLVPYIACFSGLSILNSPTFI
jgi:hypothetical protein